MYSAYLPLIPFGIAGLILLRAVFRMLARSKNVAYSDVIKILKNVKYLTVWMLICVFLLTGIFAALNHIKAKRYMTAVVSLNYSEASQAQNANGTRYNMAEIICDEVVEKAIERGAFENVTVKQLKDCLTVYPYIQGDVKEKENFRISTEFVVEYNASKHTKHLNAENIITLVTGAYKDYYVEKYADNFHMTVPEENVDFSSMEYMDIVLYLNKETTSLLNYLYGMGFEAPNYVTGSNTTFQAIAGKVKQFQTTQIEQNLRSMILQNGIAREKHTYIDRLSYQNTNLDFVKQKQEASYKLYNEAIAMYAEEMTRIVLVPTWDYSGKYYMGRTKVGIDELSVQAASMSDYVSKKAKEIEDNCLIIEKMQEAANTASIRVQVDEMIESIIVQLNAFVKEAITAGREYDSYRMNQCISVSLSGVSLFSEMKSIAVFAVFVYIAVLAARVSKKFPGMQA